MDQQIKAWLKQLTEIKLWNYKELKCGIKRVLCNQKVSKVSKENQRKLKGNCWEL